MTAIITTARLPAFCALCLCVLLVCACASYDPGVPSTQQRHELAQTIAARSNMQAENIQTTPFTLRGYYRLSDPETTTTALYIEGDGLAWLSRSRPSLDPTPTDPVALRLAGIDRRSNIYYLARPCQYETWTRKKACPIKYWTSNRFDQTVLQSYHQALDKIKAAHGIKTFDIVGFSGGAAIAAILAAQRDDITSLRTVAGNLDHAALNEYHGVSAMPQSITPITYAQKLTTMPQIHYSGGQDHIVPSWLADHFIDALDNAACAQHITVDYASHEDGWTMAWKDYAQNTAHCSDK